MTNNQRNLLEYIDGYIKEATKWLCVHGFNGTIPEEVIKEVRRCCRVKKALLNKIYSKYEPKT